MGTSIIIDGIPYVPDPKYPTEAVFYYMHDNHTFTKLKGSLADMVSEAVELAEKSPSGMLCDAILLNKSGKEVRRVGEAVHARGTCLDAAALKAWAESLSADPDIVRLIDTDFEYP